MGRFRTHLAGWLTAAVLAAIALLPGTIVEGAFASEQLKSDSGRRPARGGRSDAYPGDISDAHTDSGGEWC